MTITISELNIVLNNTEYTFTKYDYDILKLISTTTTKVHAFTAYKYSWNSPCGHFYIVCMDMSSCMY